MNHLSKVTDVITFPARTAIGAARLCISTTVSILGWVAEKGTGTAPARGTTPPVTVLPVRTQPDVDPMAATRTPPAGTTAKKAAPRKKVPASQVPLTSAPTPSMPAAALASLDEPDDVPQPATASTPTQAVAKKSAAKKSPARKAPAKKTAATKTPARKAPSKKAAVLAPALGISEAEVVDGDKG